MAEVVKQDKDAPPKSPVVYRRGTVDDAYTSFTIFEYSLADLMQRMGSTETTSAADPEALARMWAERRTLYEHLAQTAEHFWLAEQDGQAIGFSRSIKRDGIRQLTEFFILPDYQSAGVGKELLARAFPADGARGRSILSSPDPSAQALYLKAGVWPSFSIYYFWRKPEKTAVESDLVFEAITDSPGELALLGELDEELVGFRRDIDHRWLLSDRAGYLYTRAGQAVGYGYLGKRNGPFGLLDNRDFPAALAHAETAAHDADHKHFGLEVPMPNRLAVTYLLERGFRLEPFTIQFMSDSDLGQMANYILTNPPFFL
jgi:GNAT superfamily N-acetyltransferase